MREAIKAHQTKLIIIGISLTWSLLFISSDNAVLEGYKGTVVSSQVSSDGNHQRQSAPLHQGNTAETIEPPRFNPFKDFGLENIQGRDALLFSDHRCVEQPHDPEQPDVPPTYVGRTCFFRNIYFKPMNKTFHYLPTRGTLSSYNNSIEELEDRIATSSGYINNEWFKKPKRNFKRLEIGEKFRLQPTVISFDDLQNKNISVLQTTGDHDHREAVLLMYKWSYNFNPGHYIMDDLLTIYSMMDIFGMVDNNHYQHVPIHVDVPDFDPFYRCGSTSNRIRFNFCRKRFSRYGPPLMGVDLYDPQSEDFLRLSTMLSNLVAGDEEGYIRIPMLIAGAGRLAHFSCREECSIHRSGKIYKLRNWIFQNLFGAREGRINSVLPVTQENYKITVSVPYGSSRGDKVEWFENIIPTLQRKFGEDRVQVVNMAKLTVKEQVMLAQKSAVYLTNHGGGSITSLFMSRDATLILFSEKDRRRDEEFYSTQGYLNVEWFVAREATVQDVVAQVERGVRRMNLIPPQINQR